MSNIHLIVSEHEGGFFSNFNKVATFLKGTDKHISKITWNLQGQPYGAFAYSCSEVFSKLFQEYNNGQSVDEIIKLTEYTDTAYTGKEVNNKYPLTEWRYEFNQTLKYFITTPALQELQDKIEYKYIFSSSKINLIGVLKRNELLKCEQRNGVMPTLEEYFQQIDKLINENTYLYLAVDNIEDLNAFINRYKKCIYNPKVRRSNKCTDTEPHFTPGTQDDAINTYLEVFILSKCKYLVHPLSNMSTAALYFNPNLISIYI